MSQINVPSTSSVSVPVTPTQGGTGITSYATGDTLYASATNTLSKLSIGLTGAQLVVDNSGIPEWTNATSTSDISLVVDDFLYTSNSGTRVWPWSPASNGTAASAIATAPVSGHPGIVTINTGTDTSGEATIVRGTSDGSGLENCFLGDGSHDISFVCNISNLATVGEDYAIYFGLADGLNIYVTHPGNNAVVFSYNRSVSTNWQGITKSGGSSTTASGGSSVPVATGWNNFRITINAAGTSVSFYVNGTLIGTSTTNIPTSNAVSAGFVIKKSAGTTARTFDIDYFRWYYKLTTPRF